MVSRINSNKNAATWHRIDTAFHNDVPQYGISELNSDTAAPRTDPEADPRSANPVIISQPWRIGIDRNLPGLIVNLNACHPQLGVPVSDFSALGVTKVGPIGKRGNSRKIFDEANDFSSLPDFGSNSRHMALLIR